MHACVRGYNSFAPRMQVIMKVNGRMVERYWQSAVDDMYEKRLKDVLCPCQKCKGGVRIDPFKGGKFKAHLLMHGFMDGHARWISGDDDDEDVDGAGNDDIGPDEEMTPLYDGCDPEVTRLSFTLELLKTKAKNKWMDASLDELLKYLKGVLPAGNLCPTSVDEAKKIVF